MTGGSEPTPLHRRRGPSTLQPDYAPAYCARPACGKYFERRLQPGHPKIYCGDECRHAARTELRRLQSRLRDLEATVDQQRRLIAAYGSESDDANSANVDIPAAMAAVFRAGGIVDALRADTSFAANELRALYDAVRPFVTARAAARA